MKKRLSELVPSEGVRILLIPATAIFLVATMVFAIFLLLMGEDKKSDKILKGLVHFLGGDL